MFEVLRADPCRFVETILDFRSLRRILRAWRQRGTKAILDEISISEAMTSLPLPSLKSQAVKDDDLSKTLLVIDATIPQYDRDAGARSSFLYLQLLREMGCKVFFMPNDQLRREPYAGALEAMGVQLLIGRGFRCGGWKKWLSTQAGQISHIVLHRPNVALRYLYDIKHYCNAKIIYFAHDLRFLRERRHFEVKGDAFHQEEADYWESIERGILARVDWAYFFSDQEVRTVSEWGLNCIASSIPLFPVILNSDSGPSFDQRAGLLFVGGFAHQPNLDAVLWFANEVFPRVQRVLPDVKWHIVGREPPPAVRSLAGMGVIVEGTVTESRLEKLYRSTRVVIAPLRFGAGVKGKVMEAMCQGIPVVTTPVGAEGIPCADDALCVTDSAEDMAQHIVTLCQDITAWESARQRLAQFSKLCFSRTAAVHQLAEGLRIDPVSRTS